MMHSHKLLIAVLLLTGSNEVCGQSRDKQIRTHIDSALTARYYRIPYDTNYVVRPEGNLTLNYVGHLGIGGGYGYNWVIGHKWLLHFSMLPTFVVYNRNNMTVRGERKEAQHMRFNMIFNERAAVVYNFSPRYFAGATKWLTSKFLCRALNGLHYSFCPMAL